VKNISAEEMQYIVRVVDQRDEEEKGTKVFFKDIEVTRKRIENFKSKGTQKSAASRGSHTGLISTQLAVLF
jgi:hypothetical protein